jgi:hypothetical protein
MEKVTVVENKRMPNSSLSFASSSPKRVILPVDVEKSKTPSPSAPLSFKEMVPFKNNSNSGPKLIEMPLAPLSFPSKFSRSILLEPPIKMPLFELPVDTVLMREMSSELPITMPLPMPLTTTLSFASMFLTSISLEALI